MTANALLPAVDPNPTHAGIQKVDRTTVTSIHNVSAQLNKIQATVDDANSGLNPLGLAADAVPFDFDPGLARPGDLTQTHFEQMMGRAESALNNATKVFDYANQQANRIRMQATSTDTLSQQSFEQDRDYRNRLIEIFGTPHAGQIGAGKPYPEGYNGPDLALYMYVAVNDLSNDTVPVSSHLFEATWKAMPQMLEVANPADIDLGPNNPTVTPASQFRDVFSRFFISDVFQFQDGTATNAPTPGTANTYNVNNPVFSAASYKNPEWVSKTHDVFEDITPYLHTMDLDLNLPLTAVDYAFRVPADGSWGMRASPGELQSVISDMVQAQAALGLANGDYDGIVQKILHQLRKHCAKQLMQFSLFLFKNTK